MSRSKVLGVALVLLVVLLQPVKKAAAQSGACPLYSGGGTDITTPHGTYPTGSALCFTVSGSQVYTQNDPSDFYPCDQYVKYDPVIIASVVNPPGLVIVPPLNDDLDSFVRVRLYWIPQELIVPVSDGAYDSYKVTFVYYDSSETVLSTVTQDVVNYPYTDSTHGTFPTYYYRAYLLDQIISTGPGETNGYVKVIFSRDFSIVDPSTWTMAEGRIASVQIGRYADHTFPAMCPVPNQSNPLPNTPTPAPTWTPQATPPGSTPTFTPPAITPYATSPGATPTFPTFPTITPWSFPTIEAEHTPTPWAAYEMPTVEWPTRDLQVVAAAATVISQTTGLDALGDSISAAWATPVAFTGGAMDTGLTTTTGYGAPVTLVMSVTQGISLPISYGKAVGGILPNFGPYLAAMLALAAFMVFNYIAKFSIQVVAFLFELLRKIWDALPLT